MQINTLTRKTPNMKRMTVARGGKRGKTSGRGGKGQSARAGNKRRPEWRDIIKRLPKLRGRGVNQNKSVSTKPLAVNVEMLEAVFSAGDQVTPALLIERGVVSTMSGSIPAIKILGDGEVTKALKVSGCAVSESAKAKIEKAGGSVAALKSRIIEKTPTEAQAKKAAAPKKVKAPKAEKAPEAKAEKAAKPAKAPKAEKKETK